MKPLKMAIAILLMGSLSLWPMIEAMAQGTSPQKADAGQVIVISEKVGQTIDREERDHYGLFQASKNFLSAVILLLPDSGYVAKITEERDGQEQVRTLPMDRFTLQQLSEYIDSFSELTPDERRKIQERGDVTKMIEKQSILEEAREQAKILVQEKWTRERWQEETRYDQGPTYRGAGASLGFTLGAAAGMLIGKGIQGRSEERIYIPPRSGDWGTGRPGYWESHYTYQRKEAPFWGAAIGGVAGGITGYYLGKGKDKEYYILVPKDIRVRNLKVSTVGSCILGSMTVGSALGLVAEATLPTPSVEKEGESHFEGGYFLGGHLVGTLLATKAFMDFSNRSKHKRLCEESLLLEEPESSFDIELMPLDPTAFALLPRRLPSGEIIYEQRWNLMRVRF